VLFFFFGGKPPKKKKAEERPFLRIQGNLQRGHRKSVVERKKKNISKTNNNKKKKKEIRYFHECVSPLFLKKFIILFYYFFHLFKLHPPCATGESLEYSFSLKKLAQNLITKHQKNFFFFLEEKKRGRGESWGGKKFSKKKKKGKEIWPAMIGGEGRKKKNIKTKSSSILRNQGAKRAVAFFSSFPLPFSGPPLSFFFFIFF